MTEHDERELLTIPEVGLRLGLSATAVRRRIWAGEIASVRLGDGAASPVRVHRKDLDAYLDAHRRPAGSAA